MIGNYSISTVVGGDLSFHLEKEGRFNIPRVRLYVAELAMALEYLKEKDIIHRDLKPANVLLDSEGHAHLTDFNVACIVRPGLSVTSITGTKPYMGKYSLYVFCIVGSWLISFRILECTYNIKHVCLFYEANAITFAKLVVKFTVILLTTHSL